MKIRPIGERVVLKPMKAEEKTASGIILAKNMLEGESNIAEIISIGQVKSFELTLGMKVVYDITKANRVQEGEEIFFILDAQDILAIIE